MASGDEIWSLVAARRALQGGEGKKKLASEKPKVVVERDDVIM